MVRPSVLRPILWELNSWIEFPYKLLKNRRSGRLLTLKDRDPFFFFFFKFLFYNLNLLYFKYVGEILV